MDYLFKQDYYRMTGKKWTLRSYIDLFLFHDLCYLKHIRNHSGGVVHKLLTLWYSSKYGLEIYSKHIGPGLYLGHAHNINVNPNAVIGKNCNLNKGCTIGQENRGSRRGVPTLGDCVWIGTNAVVCGKITIGDDVLIAPNAYVNFDVPAHSVVIGNPGKIYRKEHATEGYVMHCIDEI